MQDPNIPQDGSKKRKKMDEEGDRPAHAHAKTKLINDPIHSFYQLDRELFKIIDTPIFQRLRDLKQLGGMYFVFPGASHNRFEHCLGTCYLAGKWMRHFRDQGVTITDREIFLVEVAGLCHDLGHGPFSHTFEDVFAAKHDIEWKHEEASGELLRLINNDVKVLTDQEVEIVKSLILGNTNNAPKEKLFMWQIVANKTNSIDVDKFDYMPRDTHNGNLPLGFQFSRLMEMSKVLDGEICFHTKESSNIHHMFLTRYYLHKQMYSHRVVKSIELMIGDALSKADDVFNITKILKAKDYKRYALLTDSILKEIERSTDERLKPAQEIVNNLYTRNLYKFIAEVAVAPDFTHKAKDLKKDAETFLKSVGLGETCIISVASYNFAMQRENPLTKVKFYERADEVRGRPQAMSAITGLHGNVFEEVYIRAYSVDRALDKNILQMFNQWINSPWPAGQLGQIKSSPKISTPMLEDEKKSLRKDINYDDY